MEKNVCVKAYTRYTQLLTYSSNQDANLFQIASKFGSAEKN